MTARQIRWATFWWLFSLASVVALFAAYFTVNARSKPIPFVPPAIWSDRLPADGPAEYEI